MRYLALASDYDGTLASDGAVDAKTIEAIERLIHSGRRLILVTGRELPDLQAAFPRLDLCERVVAENGALLFNPHPSFSVMAAARDEPGGPAITDIGATRRCEGRQLGKPAE